MELIRNNIDRIERFKEQLKESSDESNKILTDKKTGIVETYEGKYLVRKNYKDGVQHGLHERVHPNGQVMSRGTYFNGQPHGLYEGFQVTGEVLDELGFSWVFQLAGLLSVSLGILNLLPLPALDGGRLMFVLIEIARGGKKISPSLEGKTHLIGFTILVAFILVISYFDVLRILRGDSILN